MPDVNPTPTPNPNPFAALGPADYLKLTGLACEAVGAYLLRKDIKTVAADIFQAATILGLKSVLPVASESEFVQMASVLAG